MARLTIGVSQFNVTQGRDEEPACAEVEIASGLDGFPADGDYAKLQNGGYPVLSVHAAGEETEHRVSFQIVGYENIDALRRYCEMTLDLYDRGRLE
jgi:hypothetical protein